MCFVFMVGVYTDLRVFEFLSVWYLGYFGDSVDSIADVGVAAMVCFAGCLLVGGFWLVCLSVLIWLRFTFEVCVACLLLCFWIWLLGCVDCAA